MLCISALLAQLVRASASHAEGRRFDSCGAHKHVLRRSALQHAWEACWQESKTLRAFFGTNVNKKSARYTVPVGKDSAERTKEVFCVGPEYAGRTHDSGSCRPGSIPGGPTEDVSCYGLSYSGSTHGWGSCSLGSIPSSPTTLFLQLFENLSYQKLWWTVQDRDYTFLPRLSPHQFGEVWAPPRCFGLLTETCSGVRILTQSVQTLCLRSTN